MATPLAAPGLPRRRAGEPGEAGGRTLGFLDGGHFGQEFADDAVRGHPLGLGVEVQQNPVPEDRRRHGSLEWHMVCPQCILVAKYFALAYSLSGEYLNVHGWYNRSALPAAQHTGHVSASPRNRGSQHSGDA